MNEGRLKTGIEEAIYYIGIEDNGTISGVGIESINNSIKNFSSIVKLINAEVFSTQIQHTDKGIVAIIKVRKLENYLIEDEIKIGLLGASNNGKTTFLGTITYDILDDGNGVTSNMFRHDHEKLNGTTSSINYEIFGCSDDKYINYNSGFIASWEYIVKNSKKIINFIDLPGNSKYIKTTLFGLMAHRPDYILMFMSDNTYNIIDDDTQIYINLCIKLNIPFAIILTKKDMVNDTITNKSIDEIKKIIYSRILIITNENDIDNISHNVIPIIPISNVTGENINLVKFLLKSINIKQQTITDNKYTTHFMINDVIFISDVGTVVTGVLNQGRIKIGNKLLIGPINKSFYNVEIISIHKKQIPSKYIYENEIGSIVIKLDNKIDINKHSLIFSSDQLVNFHNKFKVLIKRQNYVELRKELNLMMFCKNIYDNIFIDDINEFENEIMLSVKFNNNNIQFIRSDDYVCIRYNNNNIIGNIVI